MPFPPFVASLPRVAAFVLCVFAASLALSVQAAAPRYSTVVAEIYNYNHPLAAQLPDEVATKMDKMVESPFAFYRGSAHLYFKDVASRGSGFVNNASSQVWLQGDLHVSNFGAFRDSAGKNVFGLNDFDEAYWGPYTWDVWRMAVSLYLAADAQGISGSAQHDIVDEFVEQYLDKLYEFQAGSAELSYRLDSGNTSGEVNETIDEASAQTRSALLAQYTQISSGKRVFLTTSELVVPSSSTRSAIASAMPAYINSIAKSKRYSSSFYTLKDVRQKLGSGVGSLGRYRYWLLIEGASTSTSDDVILEMKEQRASVVSLGNPGGMPSSTYHGHEGERVATSLKALLRNADVLTGYCSLGSAAYFLREKSPYQQDFDFTELNDSAEWLDAAEYLGKALAQAHAVSDKDYNASLIPYDQDKEISLITDGYHDEFRAEVRNFAQDYALQVEYDYQSFVSAYNAGVPLY